MHAYCPFLHTAEVGCMIDAPLSRRYLTSMYFVMTTLASVGFGDITPRATSGAYSVDVLCVCACLPGVTASVCSYMHGIRCVCVRLPVP